jgi:two-component system OmpR family response regulator
MTTSSDTPPLILAVDDDPAILDVLRELLSDEGYRVLTAGDGAEASRLATSEDVGLVLLDLTMPLFDAADFCRDYRAGGGRAPIVLVTAAQPDKVAGAVEACRADDVILKPFMIDEVIETVAGLVRDAAAPRDGDVQA